MAGNSEDISKPQLVDFLVRADAPTKVGGDSTQVDEYVKRLEERGFDCRVTPIRHDTRLRDGAIGHIVNIDRPFDFLLAIRKAKGHIVVVSPIHHDLEFVRRMRRAERGWAPRAIIGRWFPESVREMFAFVARSLLAANTRADQLRTIPSIIFCVHSVSRTWLRVGSALNEVESVALLARGEGDALARDTGWNGRNAALVPNGHPFVSDTAPEDTRTELRSIGLLNVGRIEPRKRQLELAREAISQGESITFVGVAPVSGSKYSAAFSEVVNGSNGLLTWAGGVAHPEVLKLMTNAKVLINASWVEVQSLVDIEAAHCGCHVVVAAGGNSEETLRENVHPVPDGGIAELLRVGARLRDESLPAKYPDRTWSWDDAVEALITIYLSPRHQGGKGATQVG